MQAQPLGGQPQAVEQRLVGLGPVAAIGLFAELQPSRSLTRR
jgi:hypothetical protein